VLVEVSQQSLKDGRAGLHFRVRDTGIGIPEDKQKLIFEAFSQADNSTSRRFGGTGLGLTISSQLVAMMGGRIWVESEAGKGSTFHFTATFELPTESVPKPETLPILGDKPVLVVDDNATNRRILQDLLAGWKIKTVMVESGATGLAELERGVVAREPFRLILTDYMMPKMTGLDFAERVRSRPDFKECEIIMLSSARPPDVVNRCRELKIARWLQKPVKQSDLLNALRTVFQPIATENFREDHGISRRPDHIPALRVLLAEDGVVNQRVAVGLLNLRGHSVVLANNGKEALSALEREPIDVVLMDVHMPELDGIEATRAIRAKEKSTARRLPIIALTASAMKGDRERCLAAGMDGYVSKPFNAQDLFDAVEGAATSTPAPAAESAAQPAATAETGTLTEVIDWEIARKRLRGRVETIALTFLEECPKLMTDLRAALSSGEATHLRRAAHTLKGSADIFAAKRVVAAAWELECLARDGRMEKAEESLSALDDEVKRLMRALEARCGTSAGAKRV
jgi:two-component system sensor histidine kinase/response regulator